MYRRTKKLQRLCQYRINTLKGVAFAMNNQTLQVRLSTLMYMIKYYPYKRDKRDKKHYIITIIMQYFGAAGMSDFTHHKNEAACKNRYFNIQKTNELWTKLVMSFFWFLVPLVALECTNNKRMFYGH